MNRYFKFKDIEITNGGTYLLEGTSNLETGSAAKRKINYVDTDGVEWRDILYQERVFEITGTIMADDEETMVSAKRKLIKACSLKEKLRMQYCNRLAVYSAECYFDKLPTFGTRKRWNLPFKLYVTIPGFYWQSKTELSFALHSYQNEVTQTFTLPCVFTSYSTEKKVFNGGDTEAYPVFIISCEEEKADKIVIKNYTSCKTVTLNYAMKKGETVTVNTQKQTVHSDKAGNITGKVTIDSEFFTILQGFNHIMCEGDGNKIVAEFYENYLGV